VPIAGCWAALAILSIIGVPGMAWIAWEALGISIAFAALVFAMRAATLGAAITGGIFTCALALQTPGRHTALWPLLALFLLTYSATRCGRARKEQLGIAEGKRGRTASQVAANLGVAVLAGIPEIAARLGGFPYQRIALAAMLAALGEATADTVSSELGQVLGGEPRLVTNFRHVPPGTNGAVTLIGTLSGSLAALAVIAVGAFALGMPRRDALLAFAAAFVGLFVDSLLGAIPERRGWLNNDAVNALSTLTAAALAVTASRFSTP
jgi:uncharacterized protein (TIGR00297 family)